MENTLKPQFMDELLRAITDQLENPFGLGWVMPSQWVVSDRGGAVIAGWSNPFIGDDDHDVAQMHQLTIQFCPGGVLHMPIVLTMIDSVGRTLTTTLSMPSPSDVPSTREVTDRGSSVSNPTAFGIVDMHQSPAETRAASKP